MGLDLPRLKRALTTPWTRARVASIAYRYGFWRANLWLSPAATLKDRVWRAVSLKNTGDASASAAIIDAALSDLPSSPLFHALMNPTFDVLISLGRYRDALALEPAIGARRDFQWAFAQVNLAEAEYCQGLWQRAEARGGDMERQITPSAASAQPNLGCQVEFRR